MSILTRGAVDLYALFEWGVTINTDESAVSMNPPPISDFNRIV